MYADMEQWTEIRRRVLVDGLSKREACQAVRDPLADAEEDPDPRGAAGVPAGEAAAAADDRTGPADHPADSGRRRDGAEEAASHGEADLAAAAGRARVHGRVHVGEGRGAGAEGRAEGGVPAARAPARARPRSISGSRR